MTAIGAATKAMVNAICKDTYYRAKKWFSEHPDVEVAYWAKDDFLPFQSDNDLKFKFVKEHPEIENIDDHTLVKFDKGTLKVWHFCKKLRDGIADFYYSGIHSGDGWVATPDSLISGNWVLLTTGE